MLRKYKYAYKAMNCRIKLKLFVMEGLDILRNYTEPAIRVGSMK